MGGLLLRTLTLAGAGGACAIAALEKVPGLQDSIEQVVPGFKDKYSHTRLATIGWYRRNFERASQSLGSLTNREKGVEKSPPSEPPRSPPKVSKPQESYTANAITTKGNAHVESQASKLPEVTPAEERQPPAPEVGRQSATQRSTEGFEKKEEAKPARKKDPVKQEHAGSKAKMPEKTKHVSETPRDAMSSSKLESASGPTKDADAELKATATSEQHREVEDALSSALENFTTAAEMAAASYKQTYAPQSLSSALSSPEDVGASSVAQLAAREQAVLTENKHAGALKEYEMRKSSLEKAILTAKEFGLDNKATRAEEELKKKDSNIRALEQAMDSERMSFKEQAVLQPKPDPPDAPSPSAVRPHSKAESEALSEKVRELEAQLEATLRAQSAEVSKLVETKVVAEVEKETLAHKAELEKQVSILLHSACTCLTLVCVRTYNNTR